MGQLRSVWVRVQYIPICAPNTGWVRLQFCVLNWLCKSIYDEKSANISCNISFLSHFSQHISKQGELRHVYARQILTREVTSHLPDKSPLHLKNCKRAKQSSKAMALSLSNYNIRGLFYVEIITEFQVNTYSCANMRRFSK